MAIQPQVLVDEGLGNSVYVLDLGDGGALVVDPSRDLRRVRHATQKAGLQVRFAAETHLHADFVSGARQLQVRDKAAVLASAAGGRGFGHTRLSDGDDVDLGGLVFRALGTPGHTDEHLSYLLLEGSRPIGVFTGGSLIVNSAARTDLLGSGRTEELARAQYRSLRHLATLPDDVAVWPTHGAGSFCSAPPGAERTSTIGDQKAANPLLAARDEDEFVSMLLAGLGSYPSYFDRLSDLNRAGPALLPDTLGLANLDAERVRRLRADGVTIVDTRAIGAFGSGHIPGAVSIPLRDQFATWLGWVVEPAAPIVIVRGVDQDPAEIVWQATKIGYDTIIGELSGGMDAWDGDVASIPVLSPHQAIDELAGVTLVDVRQTPEYAAGHLPDALAVELGELSDAALPDGPVVTMCGHGERAMTAASLAARSGRPTAVLAGGPAELAAAAQVRLLEGS